MKVLQICSKPPLPEIDGGCKAMNNITKGLLQNNVVVKILTLATHKHPFNQNELDPDYLNSTQIESAFADTRPKPIAALFNIFSCKSYNLERFSTKVFDDVITSTLSNNNFDVVLIEGLYVSMYLNTIRNFSSAKVVYRAHNIESEIWYRNATASKGLKKWYLNHLARKLERYEKSELNNFDGIAAITQKDKDKLIEMGCQIPIQVFPFGVDLTDYKVSSITNKNSIFHIGSMDWLPNQEGINWFLEKVWTDVIKSYPSVEFNLAGKNMPQILLNFQQANVNVLGEVENAVDFINQHSIMVVPLFAGSGMRIKIIEAMALQKVVIATSIAAEGINYKSGKNIIIANTAKEFVDAIGQCLVNKELVSEIGENARIMVTSSYDNKVIVNNLVEFFKQQI